MAPNLAKPPSHLQKPSLSICLSVCLIDRLSARLPGRKEGRKEESERVQKGTRQENPVLTRAGYGMQSKLLRDHPSISQPSITSLCSRQRTSVLVHPLRDQLQESEHDRPRRLWVADDWRESTPSDSPATGS